MGICVPVKVKKEAFFGCRWTMTLLVWAALIFRDEKILIVSLIIFLASAILGIRKAPLIVFYSSVFKIFKIKTKDEVLDQNAMRFAHSFGAFLNIIALILLYLNLSLAGWIVTFILALAKTSGSFGFCGALKLYGCLNSTTCCAVLKGGRKKSV